MICTHNSLEMPGYGKSIHNDETYKLLNGVKPDDFLKFYGNFYAFVEKNEALIKSKGIDLRRDGNRQMYIYDEKEPKREIYAKHQNTIIQEVNDSKSEELLALLFVNQGKSSRYNYLNLQDFRVATKYMGPEYLKNFYNRIDEVYAARGAYHFDYQNGKQIMRPGISDPNHSEQEQFSNNDSVWKRKALYDLFETLMMERQASKIQEYKDSRTLGDRLNPAKTREMSTMFTKIKADYAMSEIPAELKREANGVMQRDRQRDNNISREF